MKTFQTLATSCSFFLIQAQMLSKWGWSFELPGPHQKGTGKPVAPNMTVPPRRGFSRLTSKRSAIGSRLLFGVRRVHNAKCRPLSLLIRGRPGFIQPPVQHVGPAFTIGVRGLNQQTLRTARAFQTGHQVIGIRPRAGFAHP